VSGASFVLPVERPPIPTTFASLAVLVGVAEPLQNYYYKGKTIKYMFFIIITEAEPQEV
jgi:hypothetical protein